MLQAQHDFSQIAFQYLSNIPEILVDPVIGNSILREVVRANLLRTIARADLTLTQTRFRLFRLATLAIRDNTAQHPHRPFAVMHLRTLLAARYYRAGGLMGNPN